MIKFIIAFDNQNETLGQYFEDCKNDIVDFLEEQNHLAPSCLKISDAQCNVAYIDLKIPQYNPQPFIFIAYSHGEEDRLMCHGNAFVSLDNCHHFSNSLFYSTACLIGKRLAPALIESECIAFIGFNEETRVIPKGKKYRKTFIDCDNFAIKLFLSSEKTVGESFEAMKNYYTTKIDMALELREDSLYISLLRESRDALIRLGDKNLKKEDLFVYE